PRILGAALVALPYLAAAYLAQGAFKEPIEALFVLSFALLLPRAATLRRAIPLGVIAAGAVYTYSFPGLFWLVGAAAVWLIASWRVGGVQRENRRLLLAVAGVLVVMLALTAPEWARLIDFTHFRAFRNSTIS